MDIIPRSSQSCWIKCPNVPLCSRHADFHLPQYHRLHRLYAFFPQSLPQVKSDGRPMTESERAIQQEAYHSQNFGETASTSTTNKDARWAHTVQIYDGGIQHVPYVRVEMRSWEKSSALKVLTRKEIQGAVGFTHLFWLISS